MVIRCWVSLDGGNFRQLNTEISRCVGAGMPLPHDRAEQIALDSDSRRVSPKNRTFQHVPQFTDKLLRLLTSHHTDLAIQLYQKLIDWTALSRKREDYAKVGEYLTRLREIYQHLNRAGQWSAYLADFQKQHTHKRLLLRIIAESLIT